MSKARLEAFSDAVIAIILTIMVLELEVPHEPTLAALAELWPVWVAYALSYYNVFVFWANHHHAFEHATTVDRGVLFANGLFLFCLSLIPFATAFAGQAHWSSSLPVVLYGLVMLAASLTFGRLQQKLSRQPGDREASTRSDAKLWRSYRSSLLPLAGSVAALAHPRLGLLFFVAIPIALRIARRPRPAEGDA